MITLPKEPWRGGQICGHQTAYGLPWSIFCGEFKKPGSPLCEVHDKEMREENDGVLPKFAPGNALGLAAYRRKTMPYMFQLAWEPYEGDTPEAPTPEELAAFYAQLNDKHRDTYTVHPAPEED